MKRILAAILTALALSTALLAPPASADTATSFGCDTSPIDARLCVTSYTAPQADGSGIIVTKIEIELVNEEGLEQRGAAGVSIFINSANGTTKWSKSGFDVNKNETVTFYPRAHGGNTLWWGATGKYDRSAFRGGDVAFSTCWWVVQAGKTSNPCGSV